MKSMRHLARNVWAALADPEILQRWVRYQWALRAGREPTLRIDGAAFSGFPDFNAYLGAWKYRPPKAEIAFLERALRGARTVVDAGANFGVFTASMAALAPDAYIYAFEPHPGTFGILERNVAQNHLGDRVRRIQRALGRTVGIISFEETGTPATNRIAAKGPDTIEVEITTLDAFCLENGAPTIDFLKIDVEGAEFDLLTGAQKLFAERRVGGGMIEICPGHLKRFAASVADLRAFFAEHDYDLCWWDLEGRPAGPVSADLPDVFSGNAAFMPSLPGRLR